MIPDNVLKFREHYKNTERPKIYSGAAHFLFEISICLTVIILAARQIHSLNFSHIILFPLGFIIANFVEYLGHRYLLHINHPLSRIGYREHTVKHHHYFTEEAIDLVDSGDLHRILFPWFGVLFFVIGLGVPMAILMSKIWDVEAGYIFFLVSVSYFLLYEMIHFICHVPDNNLIFKVPGLIHLKKHHQQHHNLKLMVDTNFNVVCPIFDYLFKTKKN